MIKKKNNLYAPKRDHEENKERIKLKKLMGKRVRSSEDTVLNLMFDAFSKNQYISMADLEHKTQQPKNFLQQLVKRYCNYNNAVKHLNKQKKESQTFLCFSFLSFSNHWHKIFLRQDHRAIFFTLRPHSH